MLDHGPSPARRLPLGAKGATLFFLLVVSALVWPMIALLSVLLVLPLGWQIAVANVLLDVTAEATPAGEWTVHLFDPPTSQELGTYTAPLMHSVIYDNPRVLALICEWISASSLPRRVQNG